MKKYITNAVIFDLDGTVADTLDDLKNSVNYAVGLLGVEPYDRPTVQSFIGSVLTLQRIIFLPAAQTILPAPRR